MIMTDMLSYSESWKKPDYGTCWVNGKKALFHTWEQWSDVIPLCGQPDRAIRFWRDRKCIMMNWNKELVFSVHNWNTTAKIPRKDISAPDAAYVGMVFSEARIATKSGLIFTASPALTIAESKWR